MAVVIRILGGLNLLLVVSLCLYGDAIGFPSLVNRKFVKNGTISIGGIFPIHVGASFRPNYMTMSQAMVYAVEKINNDSSILPNISLGFEVYDSYLSKRLAMEIALEMVNRQKMSSLYEGNSDQERCISHSHGLGRIPAMIGTGTSSSSILVSNLLQVEGLPIISYAATSDELSKSNVYSTFFRTVPPDRFQSQAMADIACRFNWTYVAAIAVDNAYGRSGIDYFRKKSQEKGTCLAMEGYFPEPTHNLNATKEKIQKIIKELKTLENVDVVVLYCTSRGAKLVMEEVMRQKVSHKTWIASEGWGNSRKMLDENLMPVIKGLVGVVLRNSVVDEFVEYLVNLPSTYRPVDWWTKFWDEQFGTVNPKITREIYINKMHTSMSANVINAVFAIAHALDAMQRCKEPFGLLDGGKCPSITNPKDLLRYLHNVNFTSPVSRVHFDANGDPDGSYSIVNLQEKNGSWEFTQIGSWVAARNVPLDLDDAMIMWDGDSKGDVPRSICKETCSPGYRQTAEISCCWECINCGYDEISTTYGAKNCTKCPPETIPNPGHTKCLDVPIVHITYDSSVGKAFLVIGLLGFLASVCVALLYIKYNSTPVVKASNRDLSYMLLFCISMCYLAPFVYLAEPSNLVCVLSQVWFYLFYTTCIVILGAKTNKIVLLFQERMPRSKFSSGFGKFRHVFFVVCTALAEIIIIVVWVSVDRPSPYLDKSNDRMYIQTCKPSVTSAGKACSNILMVILILASFTCSYFAYKARKLPDNFNEGKFIAFSMYILVISWLAFYPVYLNIHDIYSVVVLSATTIVAATGLLFCMFWPKIYIIIWRPHKNTKQYMKEQLTRHAFRLDTAETAARHQKNMSTSSTNEAISVPTDTQI
ncbi:extracellular calcium-sensing receptor-like [Actinia tenebrosa]|uniref:Extracellular calcium-sensing receptor-like n=1 Tax=Actinia tenebrosa TaxID=6105 RepID=A0A6P8ISZ9_ACTTE|nr:extracellular calcium-sensing receptor-like [Actinia tenebrosa]